MNFEVINSIACRVFFFGAFLLMALAVIERIALLCGYTILRGAYAPGRLLEFSAVLVIFVIALLLRQIREELSAK